MRWIVLVMVLGCAGSSGQSSDKEMTSFAFLAANNPALAVDVVASINDPGIVASLPLGIDFTSLKATFTTTGTAVTAAGATQISGVTETDFTVAVVYSVHAEDGTFKVYTVDLVKGFEAPVTLATGVDPTAIAIADLDGDGELDLVVTNANDGFPTPANPGIVSVLRGMGDGTFQPAVEYTTGSTPVHVAIADLNGDAKLDLAVVCNRAADNGGSVEILLGNGDATFQTPVIHPAFAAPRAVAIGDLDGDTTPDLAVAVELDGAVLVLLGNGDGTFQSAIRYPTGGAAYTVAIGDLDQDEIPDLVAASFSGVSAPGGSVSVLLGNGDGTFQTSVEHVVGTNPIAAEIGDLNGDGTLDVAAANYGDNTLAILFGNGDGSFQPVANVPVGQVPMMVTIRDLDGDTRLDLVQTNHRDNTVSVLLGKGDGTFKPRMTFGTGTSPRAIGVADLDGDGRVDVTTANFEADNLSILFSVSTD